MLRFPIVFYVMSSLLGAVGMTMLVPTLVAYLYGELDFVSNLIASSTCLALGGSGYFLSRRKNDRLHVTHREGFLIVGLAWFTVAAAGALPYYFYGLTYHRIQLEAERHPSHSTAEHKVDMTAEHKADKPAQREVEKTAVNPNATHYVPCEPSLTQPGSEFCDFTNAFFESVSGFTTTGATVIQNGLWRDIRRGDEKELPHGLLLWRSLTQWLGGMGIVVLAVAILPLLGIGGMQLYKAEVPGPTKDKMVPRVREAAKQLWKVYVLLTTVEALLLMLAGVNGYLALNHALTTMATGGFSPLSASVSGLENSLAEAIIVIFMFIAGTNFFLHFNLFRSGRWNYWQDSEFRFYSCLTVAASLLIALSLWTSQKELGLSTSLGWGVFQTVSIMTTTGFANVNFDVWREYAPLAAFAILCLLFVGGCAGSTSGGMKCIRLWLLGKAAYREIFRLIHPHSVTHIKISRKTVEERVLSGLMGFASLFVLSFVLSSLALSAMGLDMISAMTAAITSLGNVGPGFAAVGPAESFFGLPTAAKWLLAFLMILGRLELYTLLVLIIPAYWRD